VYCGKIKKIRGVEEYFGGSGRIPTQ